MIKLTSWRSFCNRPKFKRFTLLIAVHCLLS